VINAEIDRMLQEEEGTQMNYKKSRKVTVSHLRDAALEYTTLRTQLNKLSRETDKAYNRLQTLLKRASAPTVKEYLVGDVDDMHRIPNPNLSKEVRKDAI
jgi:hypothetical protein